MKKQRQNIQRLLRLQIKTGFLLKEPDDYQFMKRYPPIGTVGDANKAIRKIENPYERLYDEALLRHPAFQDERIYPAYWHIEPAALTLAKKQYALMQTGMDKDEAYELAFQQIKGIEEDEYDTVKQVYDKLRKEGAASTFMSDPAIRAEIKEWESVLASCPYDDLDDADKGELDYMIQTKILKWNEVERERRMIDPAFAFQFYNIRTVLFPGIQQGQFIGGTEEEGELRNFLEKATMKQGKIEDLKKLQTTKDFYYEDYRAYFEKAKENPFLRLWSQPDRIQFSHWIIKTLATKLAIDTFDHGHLKLYLEGLRKQFFPMIEIPAFAEHIDIPSAAVMKQVLYDNKIGYHSQNEESKLFIKRFYLLPELLFPEQVLTRSIMNDEDRLEKIRSGQIDLGQELKEAGIDEKLRSGIEEQLEKYATTKNEDKKLSILDRLINENVSQMEEVSSSSSSASASTSESAASDESAASEKGLPTKWEFDDALQEELIGEFAYLKEIGDSDYAHDTEGILVASEVTLREDLVDLESVMMYNVIRQRNEKTIRKRLTHIFNELDAARIYKRASDKGLTRNRHFLNVDMSKVAL